MKRIYSSLTPDLENKDKDLEQIIADENLKPNEARKFMDRAFQNGKLNALGTEFANILPAISMFREDNARGYKKRVVLEKLSVFFEKYSRQYSIEAFHASLRSALSKASRAYHATLAFELKNPDLDNDHKIVGELAMKSFVEADQIIDLYEKLFQTKIRYTFDMNAN